MFESTKYIVFADNGNRVLTHGGFKKIDKLNNSTIRLFNFPSDAKTFLNKHVTYYRLKVDIKEVKVNYEVVE